MKHLIALLIMVSTARAQAPVDVRFLEWNVVDPAAVCAQMATADAETVFTLRRAAQFQVMNGFEGAAPAQSILDCLDAHGINPPMPDLAASSTRVPKKATARKRRSSARAPAAGR